jgi:AraC family transcriptional regulator
MTDYIRQRMQREEYLARINRVIDYIENNIDGDLSLENLSKIANFSRFHFHRIFKSMLNETLNSFIQRVRIEKAATQLVSNPRKTITEIALDTGFSGSATFARAFRELFNMSASTYRSVGKQTPSNMGKSDSKKGKTIGKNRQDILEFSFYIDAQTQNPTWRIQMKAKPAMKVEVKEMPAFTVAYVRHIGPYKGDSALFDGLFNKLMTWAGPRGLLRFPDTKVLSVYHDDPKITDETKLRTSACITIPEDAAVGGEIGKMTLQGGQFAVASFELKSDEYEDAWDELMGAWMPDSGYQPDDRLCYELCHTSPKDHPEGRSRVDICVPVKPL